MTEDDKKMTTFLVRIKARLSPAQVLILIEEGIAKSVKGYVSKNILSTFSQMATEKGIKNGIVAVKTKEEKQTISFSGPFDTGTKQQFANVWFAQPQRKKLIV